jgi:two-component system LytT family response regulator
VIPRALAAPSPPRSTYSALVVDDEAPARSELRELIAGVDWLSLVGEAASGPEAVERIDELEPDVVFMDIRLPGGSGLEVLGRTRHHPVTVFTTAYDEHAVTAFGLGALDYLLKPFGEERFLTAAGRVRKHLDAAARDRRERLQEVILDGSPVRRVFVKDRGRFLPVEASAIVRLEADGDYVWIHSGDGEYLVYARLKELHARLDPARFVRVHRSHVVNLEHVEELAPHPGGRFEIRFEDGTSIVSSRRYGRNLRDLIL